MPHFVYQSSIFPLGNHDRSQQKPALKSLYVYKARGVRRKPFLIDRKPADGDEPSRYLTTLAASLGIWVDLGLCPTPRLRCPRRREILRRGKENFCVPFDKRWWIHDDNETLMSEVEHRNRRIREQTYGEAIRTCWNCDATIADRCEACVHQMTCSCCEKPLCHNCAYVTRSGLGQVQIQASQQQQQQQPVMSLLLPQQNTDGDDMAETELSAAPSKLLVPCCKTSVTHADNLCASCFESVPRAACSMCDKQLCIKHELGRCRRCEGGCGQLFCFSTDSREPGCGELEHGKANIKDCLSCGMEVCGNCRKLFTENKHSSAPSPAPSEDDDGSESTISAGDGGQGGIGPELSRKTSCGCRVCLEHYYCPDCWPSKPMPCEPRPTSILRRRRVMGGNVTLLQIAFEDPSVPPRWYTPSAFSELHSKAYPTMMEEFNTRRKMKGLDVGYFARLEDPDDDLEPGLGDIPDSLVEVGEDEWILERVLSIKPGFEDGEGGAESHVDRLMTPRSLILHEASSSCSVANERGDEIANAMVLCKWLGRGMTEVTWTKNKCFSKGTREGILVEDFILCLTTQRKTEMLTEQEEEEVRTTAHTPMAPDNDDSGGDAVVLI